MKYDAVVVLGGGLMKVGDEFKPTDYAHGDQFGMMGGDMRVFAAAALFKAGEADEFVFTTGKAPHQVKMFGEDIPTEAFVYGKMFSELVGDDAEVEVIHEDRSTSSLTNITEVLTIVHGEGWKYIAILTNEYHAPRVKALYEAVLRVNPQVRCAIDFISAEEVLRHHEPGKYDSAIDAAYDSADGKKRLENEAKGLADVAAGKYQGLTDIRIGTPA